MYPLRWVCHHALEAYILMASRHPKLRGYAYLFWGGATPSPQGIQGYAECDLRQMAIHYTLVPSKIIESLLAHSHSSPHRENSNLKFGVYDALAYNVLDVNYILSYIVDVLDISTCTNFNAYGSCRPPHICKLSF